MIVDRACVFRLGERLFAFPGQDVQEVHEIDKLNPVPRSSPVLLGLVASRGLIYPLLDLAFKLEHDEKLLNSDNPFSSNSANAFLSGDITPQKSNKLETRQNVRHALVVRDGEGEVALAVDEVMGYESQEATDDSDMQLEIAAALGMDTATRSEDYPSYFQGDIFYFAGQEVMMLNLMPLLDSMAIEVV